MDNPIYTILISSVTGIFTFFMGQKRARKEIDSIQLTNIEQSLDIYNRIIEDLRGQIESMMAKVDSLEKKVDELKRENRELKQMLRDKE